jgi:hypothetical protein
MQTKWLDWLGLTVVLRIDIEVSRFPLRGRVIGTSSEAVNLRVAESMDVIVPTSVVTDIELDVGAAFEEINIKGSCRRPHSS